MDFTGGVGRRMYNSMAFSAVGTGYTDAIESGEVKLDKYKLDQWRLMHIGAQPVPPSLIKRWKKYFP